MSYFYFFFLHRNSISKNYQNGKNYYEMFEGSMKSTCGGRMKEAEKIGDLLIFIRHVSLPSVALLSIVSFVIFAKRTVTSQQRNAQPICLTVCILKKTKQNAKKLV